MKDFVDLLNKEIEELQKALNKPISCQGTATDISNEMSYRIMLENQKFYKQGCLSKNYYYEHQIKLLTNRWEKLKTIIQDLADCSMNYTDDTFESKLIIADDVLDKMQELEQEKI